MYSDKLRISRELKAKFGQDNKIPGFEEQCVFCFCGANQTKKGIGAMVDATGLLASPQVSVILALKGSDCQIGTYRFVGEYDMQDLLHVPQVYLIGAALNDESHRDIFRMSDFLLYPSQGEAPGLQIGEAQLCGCIPICTNYTGMPEESCAPELLIHDFVHMRGQFNCYRAIVGAPALRDKMEQALDLWHKLQASDEGALQWYQQFQYKVADKFLERTWANTAATLDSIFQSLLAGGLRIELDVQRL